MSEVNLETISLEELKALALKEATEEEPEARPIVQAKSTNQEDELDNSADTQEDNEPEEYLFRREIDLEDGSGVQVFTGKGNSEVEALKDLNDKLFDAQKNASKTIREFQKRTPKVEQPVEKTFSDDEEYVFRQLGEKKPSEQFKTLFKEVTGMDVAEFKTTQSAVKEYQAVQRSYSVQQEFVNQHPDYEGTPENGQKITEWVKSHNYNEFTLDNLEKAYQDLKKSGLLNLKSDEASEATEEVTENTGRIAQPVVTTTQPRSPKKSSTVSARAGRTPVIKTGPSEDELYKMPLDQLRRLSNEQLAKMNQE